MKVCVAKDDKYDDSMGAYTLFHMWDGEKCSVEGGMYSGLSYDYYSVDATLEQKRAASIYVEENTSEGHSYNKYAGCDTYVGCIVVLARSRKAPNKVELKVVGYNDRYYNNHYGYWQDATIDLVDEKTGERYNNISIGCIKECVKGVKELPFWYVSQEELDDKLESNMTELTAYQRGWTRAEIEHNQHGKKALKELVEFYKSNENDCDEFDLGVFEYAQTVPSGPILRVYCQVDGWEMAEMCIENLISQYGFDKVISNFKKLNGDIGFPFWGWHLEY